MSDIRTQVFLVEVSATIMPEMTEAELQDAVLHLAYQKEMTHGMGALGVHVRELGDIEIDELEETIAD